MSSNKAIPLHPVGMTPFEKMKAAATTTTLCEFGACRRAPKVRVTMRNFKTQETRTTHVCRDHLRDVLSACERENLQSEMFVLPAKSLPLSVRPQG